jgi:hypothetical protein
LVGALMEDACAEAVTAVIDPDVLRTKVRRLQEINDQCRELLRVAHTLARINNR